MAPPLKTHCKHGHRFTQANTLLDKLASGYTVRKCRRCRNEFDKLRYHNNPKRQAAVRHQALLFYHGVNP
jgi:hypothetical protein